MGRGLYLNRMLNNQNALSRLRILPVILIAVMAVASLSFAERATQPGAARLKARYYFLQGAAKEAEGKADEAYEYYKKAWITDPSYPEGAHAYGLNRAILNTGSLMLDSAKLNSVNIAKLFVDTYPEDYYPVLNYAYMAVLADTTDEILDVMERVVKAYPQRTQALLYLAQYAEMRGNYKRAADALSRFETAEGSNPEITLRKSSYALFEGDTAAAIAETDRLIAKNPRNPEFLTLKGNIYEFLQRPDSALVWYVKALDADPGSGLPRQQIARIYKNLGDSALFDRYTYELLFCDDVQLEGKIATLSQYLQQLINSKGNTERGDTLFNALSNQYPHEPQILDLSARYNAAKQNFPKAIEDMTYAIDLDPQDERKWVSLMSYYALDSLFTDGMKVYDRARKTLVVPPSDDLLIVYASLAQQADSTDTALAVYDSLIGKVIPGLKLTDSVAAVDRSIFKNMGVDDADKLSIFYEMAGDAAYAAKPPRLPDAFRSYENALFFNPDNLLALNNYAYFIITEENPSVDSPRFAKAKEMSKKAVERASDNGTYLDTYAWILYKEGDYQEALKYQKAAVEISEKNEVLDDTLYSHYGDILFMAGEPDEAVRYWEKALEINPSDELLIKKVKHKTFFYK